MMTRATTEFWALAAAARRLGDHFEDGYVMDIYSP
jgi:hypothetical protein